MLRSSPWRTRYLKVESLSNLKTPAILKVLTSPNYFLFQNTRKRQDPALHYHIIFFYINNKKYFNSDFPEI